MGKVKQQYQDQLAESDEELWSMLEYAYEAFLMTQQAYAYEDTQNPNTVRQETKEQQ